jgi:pheromone a factor receptor
MRLELPVLSFLSVALLILILPGQVRSYSIPSASIIAWLFFCNLIHGINSILWSGNQAVHAPTWCDICEISAYGSDCILISFTASVVLLGAMVALPGCLLCISRRLEMITSIGLVEQKRGRIYDKAFEAVVCLLLPTLYMGLRASYDLWLSTS